MLTEITGTRNSEQTDSPELYKTGIRPAITDYLTKKSEILRDYGEYWGASSAGYCMRLNILKRLQIPHVAEIRDDLERTTRVFECGHIFHAWMQGITDRAGLSIAQELELKSEKLKVIGHIDDLIQINNKLILYDYKTANSQAFNYKRDDIGHYHKMQLGTYLYMLRHVKEYSDLIEGRIMQISKDDLRMREQQLMYSPSLEKQVVQYWTTLNGYWESRKLPRCTCADFDGGFMSRRSKLGKIYNPFFFDDIPCATEWITKFKELQSWSIQ